MKIEQGVTTLTAADMDLIKGMIQTELAKAERISPQAKPLTASQLNDIYARLSSEASQKASQEALANAVAKANERLASVQTIKLGSNVTFDQIKTKVSEIKDLKLPVGYLLFVPDESPVKAFREWQNEAAKLNNFVPTTWHESVMFTEKLISFLTPKQKTILEDEMHNADTRPTIKLTSNLSIEDKIEADAKAMDDEANRAWKMCARFLVSEKPVPATDGKWEIDHEQTSKLSN